MTACPTINPPLKTRNNFIIQNFTFRSIHRDCIVKKQRSQMGRYTSAGGRTTSGRTRTKNDNIILPQQQANPRKLASKFYLTSTTKHWYQYQIGTVLFCPIRTLPTRKGITTRSFPKPNASGSDAFFWCRVVILSLRKNNLLSPILPNSLREPRYE